MYAPREETLIDRSKLVARELILRKTNNAIAKWLDRRSEDRAKIMKTLKRDTGQLSIFSYLIPAEIPSALRINLQGGSLHVHDEHDLSS